MKRTVFALALGLLIGSAGTAVAANTDTVQATLAKFFVQVGTGKAQEVTAVVIDGTSYYPIRTIANMLNQDVDYIDETRTIILNPKKGENSMTDVATDWISLHELTEKYSSISVTIPDPKVRKIEITFNENTYIIDFPKDDGEIIETSIGRIKLERGILFLDSSAVQHIIGQ